MRFEDPSNWGDSTQKPRRNNANTHRNLQRLIFWTLYRIHRLNLRAKFQAVVRRIVDGVSALGRPFPPISAG